MKNKYLTGLICLALTSAMTLGSIPAWSEEEVQIISQDPEPADQEVSFEEETEAVPEEPEDTEGTEAIPEETPSEDPEPEETPVPEAPEEDPAATPTVTPTVEPTVTPTPIPGLTSITEAAQKVLDAINKLAFVELTLEDHEETVKKIREDYDKLTDLEKAWVVNYNLLKEYEKKIEDLKAKKAAEEAAAQQQQAATQETTAQTSTPVYYTNMVSNIHAGKDFYLDSLSKNYGLSFSSDFPQIMEQIENEFKQKKKLVDYSDLSGSITSSKDTLLVRNWQDILAIYMYEESKKGHDTVKLDGSAKDELARIFEEMNSVVRDRSDITRVGLSNKHINYYIKQNNIEKDDRDILKKYVETDCKLLCAVVTGSKGFVRQSVGDKVSEERVNVISAAYSLVGEVGYFWGGKYGSLGNNPSWGSAATVTAEGSSSTGTVRAYGLDCSGFVSWAVINGYQSTSMYDAVGEGTSQQWTNANVVTEANAQPGDLVFQRGPEAGSDNHVGILCGKTDSGDWIAVHCSSSKNGVTVGEAYSASFRYIRQPAFYPTKEELEAMQEDNFLFDSGSVALTDSLLDIFESGQNASRPAVTVKTEKTVVPIIIGDYLDDDELIEFSE